MKSMSKITALLILVAFVAVSCGKYEEGPKISILPKASRLINDWKLESKYINGTEETLTDADKAYVYSVQKDGKLEYSYNAGIVTITGTGTWEFDDSKESVNFSYTAASVTYTHDFTILRLTKDEFWCEETTSFAGFSTTTESHFVTN